MVVRGRHVAHNLDAAMPVGTDRRFGAVAFCGVFVAHRSLPATSLTGWQGDIQPNLHERGNLIDEKTFILQILNARHQKSKGETTAPHLLPERTHNESRHQQPNRNTNTDSDHSRSNVNDIPGEVISSLGETRLKTNKQIHSVYEGQCSERW